MAASGHLGSSVKINVVAFVSTIEHGNRTCILGNKKITLKVSLCFREIYLYVSTLWMRRRGYVEMLQHCLPKQNVKTNQNPVENCISYYNFWNLVHFRLWFIPLPRLFHPMY